MKRSAMGTKCEDMSLSVTLSVIAGVADSKSHRQSYRVTKRLKECLAVSRYKQECLSVNNKGFSFLILINLTISVVFLKETVQCTFCVIEIDHLFIKMFPDFW